MKPTASMHQIVGLTALLVGGVAVAQAFDSFDVRPSEMFWAFITASAFALAGQQLTLSDRAGSKNRIWSSTEITFPGDIEPVFDAAADVMCEEPQVRATIGATLADGKIWWSFDDQDSATMARVLASISAAGRAYARGRT